MINKKELILVIVAYNEEKQIIGVLNSIPNYVDRIIVVDDASLDKTVQVVEEFASKSSLPIVIERHDRNLGSGAAHMTGFNKALQYSFDILACIDGDGQMDLNDLIRLIKPVAEGRTDVAKANRLLYKNPFKRIPLIRLIGNAILTFITKIFSGYWHISDSQSGYFVMKRNCIENLVTLGLCNRFGWPNDLLIKLNILSCKVVDVVTRPIYRVGEKSKLNVFSVALPVFFVTVKSGIRRFFLKYLLYDCSPILFFYFFGFLSFVVGTVGGLITLYLDIFVPTAVIGYGYMLLFTMLIIAGFQLILFGMLFDRLENTHLKGDL